MSDWKIPEEVSQLLAPLSGSAPSGDDPEMNEAFLNLDALMSQMGQVDYASGVEWATQILREESKHLRVAAWLTLCWYRTEGVAGFKNGLLLMLKLLESHEDQLYPANPRQRSKALQFLNVDKRFRLLEQETVTAENAPAFREAQQIMDQLVVLSNSLFQDSPPKLEDIQAIIRDRAMAVPAAGDVPSSPELPESPDASDTAAREALRTEPDSPDATAAESQAPESPAATVAEAPAEETGAEPETPEVEIPVEVSELLEDINTTAVAGEDAENSQNQDLMVLYMSLDSEIAKYSENDYTQCMLWATEILRHHSKHLRVAVWLLIAWYRTEHLNGFRNGLLLIIELLKKYGDQLYPSKNKIRSKVIQVLNSDSRLLLIGKEEANEENFPRYLEIMGLFSVLEELCEQQFPENPPRLNVIKQLISERWELLQEKRQQESKPAPALAAEKDAAAAPPRPTGSTAQEPETVVSPPEKKPEGTAQAAPVARAASPVTAIQLQITEEKDAKIAIKKALSFYFESGEEGKKTRRYPPDPAVYGLSRMFRWGNVKLPPHQDNVTQLEGPNEPKQNYIRKLFKEKKYQELIPEVEINFLNNPAFLFWLDAHFYVVQALETLGEEEKAAAEEIKLHLARLVNRLTELPQLLFRDKKTAFASEATAVWLAEELASLLDRGKAVEQLLPPIIGEDYEPINEEYQSACAELPENFEQNIKTMQEKIAADTRPKGRFLRMLNLANYCSLAGRYSIARALYNQLMEKIEEYHIIEWERALCVSVWQSIYLLNRKLLESDISPNQKAAIEQQQLEMFDRIAKYDSVLALNLSSPK